MRVSRPCITRVSCPVSRTTTYHIRIPPPHYLPRIASQKYYALHSRFFPGYNCVHGGGEDAMHLEADGLLPYHGYWTFYSLIVGA